MLTVYFQSYTHFITTAQTQQAIRTQRQDGNQYQSTSTTTTLSHQGCYHSNCDTLSLRLKLALEFSRKFYNVFKKLGQRVKDWFGSMYKDKDQPIAGQVSCPGQIASNNEFPSKSKHNYRRNERGQDELSSTPVQYRYSRAFSIVHI